MSRDWNGRLLAILQGWVRGTCSCQFPDYAEQLGFVDIYAQQISRWRRAARSTGQTRELRQGIIERVMGMSDAELGLHALLGGQPPRRR